MQSNKKTGLVTGKKPASGSFANALKDAKKPKAGSVDHNMVFVTYLMENGMRDHIENHQAGKIPFNGKLSKN